jgi:outer membrane protein OmpA-like peptidoglycan-associated protein
MIATAAFGAFLMAALNLSAEVATNPSADDTKALDSSSAAVAEPALAQDASMAPATPYSAGRNIGTPKYELFLGYSYLHAVPGLTAGNRLVWLNGGSASIAYNFNRYLGIVADFGALTNSEVKFTGAYTSTVDVNNANVNALTYLFGPRLSFRKYNRITPFAQALFGVAHANAVVLTPCTTGCTILPSQGTFAMTAGGGLDVRVHRHIAIRIVQAEYLMTRFQDYTTGTTATQNDVRLSSGIVFRFGGYAAPLPPPSPLAYSCSVNPTSVFPGDAIAISGRALNLNPAKTAVYKWSADGGTVAGVGSTGKIDTTNLAPGAYMLKGHVAEGDRPGENADCSAPYVVRAFEPPTVSCTANPSFVLSGAPSTITAIGVSPQNRPLTYTYNSTSGSVSGSGTSATLSTVGAQFGIVGVTCNVVDDKGQTASSATSVTVAAAVAAIKPQTSALCSIHFDRDLRRPSRVNNEGKACLDEIALNLQRSPDAQLAVVGNSGGKERGGKKLAAERAVNAKAYLVSDKGIDPSRIAVYTGSQDERTVSNTLIPAGATLDTTGSAPVE